MKKEQKVFISALFILGSCSSIKIVQSTKLDYTIPTITKKESGYYLTRCACYYFDSIIDMGNVYPENMNELIDLQKKGFTCSNYSYPISWIK